LASFSIACISEPSTPLLSALGCLLFLFCRHK
jgi:hypothetical protein